MVCIIEKNYQAELEEYSRLFGGGQKGYDTAYTLLCMNNGYTLDKAPNGEDSILYRSLLDIYDGDANAALIEKATYYSDDYIKNFGNWTEETIFGTDNNGEPMLFGETATGNFKSIFLTDNNIETVFSEFLQRTGFDTEVIEGKRSVLDLANKIIYVASDTTIEDLARVMAEVGFYCQTKQAKYKLRRARNLNPYDTSSDDLIINDIKNNIIFVKKTDEDNYDEETKNSILSTIKKAIRSIFDNRQYYEDAVNKIADKLLNVNDDYFNTVVAESFERKNITSENIHSTKIGVVYDILTEKYNAGIDGSSAIRLQGSLYRKKEEDFHDLDFTFPFDDLSWELSKMFTNYYDGLKSGAIQDARAYHETLKKQANDILVQFPIYKDLKKHFDDVHVKNVFYNKGTGICLTIECDGFPVDFFYTKNPTFYEINGIKVTRFNVAFRAKLIMGREKDIRDIINFKKYTIPENLVKKLRTNKYTFTYENGMVKYMSSMDAYVKGRVTGFIRNNPSATDEEIMQEEYEAQLAFANHHVNEIVKSTQQSLAKAFGLKRNKDGSFETTDDSPTGKLRVNFVNSIGEHPGQIDMALHTITIGMDKGDPTTFNHELAHFYVRSFWDTPLIQKALRAFDEKGISDKEREERLVEAITEISMDSAFKSAQENWASGLYKYWNKFAAFLYKAFDIRNEKAKKIIAENVTRSFIVNEQLKNANIKHRLYNMHEGIMYQSKEPQNRKRIYTAKYENVSHDKAVQNIMNYIQSRESSARRNNNQNQAQLIKLQNAVYSAKKYATRITEAIQANNAAEELSTKAQFLIEFMENGVTEMREYINMLRSSEANGYRKALYDIDPTDGSYIYHPGGANEDVLSDHTLVNMQHDVINFFKDTFLSIGKVIEDARLTNAFNQEDFNKLSDVYNNSDAVRMATELSTIYEKAVEKRVYEYIDSIIDNEANLDEDMKFRLKVQMRKWLTDAMDYGDISSIEVWAGIASQSKSPVIRALQYMIDKTVFASDNIVKEKGDELQEKLRKARRSLGLLDRIKYGILPINIQRVFMERDRGLFTGNFATRINNGKYHNNREDYSNNLLYGKNGKGGIVGEIRALKDSSGKQLFPKDPVTLEEFDLEFDKYGNPVFPDVPEVYDIEKKYMREMEKFYAKNTDRPYLPIYYETRLNMLSVPTLRALRQFDDKIGELKRMCTVAGFPHYDLLTASQQDELKQLEDQKHNLAEFYNLDGSLKEDDSDEYKIAKELYEFNQEVNKHVAYTVDREAYENALNSSKNKARFLESNTKWIVNPRQTQQFTDLIPSYEERLGSSHPLVKEYKELVSRRNQLISIVKKPGFEYPDISKLWDQNKVELKFPELWKNLKIIDRKINLTTNKIRNALGKAGKVSKEDVLEAKDLFRTVQIPLDPDANVFDSRTLTWYRKIQNDIKNSNLSYAEKIVLLNKISIDGPEGNPLTIFNVRMPYKGVVRNGIKYGRDENGEYEMFIRVPLSHFNKVDTDFSDPTWVNTSFKSENGHRYVPKESLYKNEEYEKYVENGTTEMKELYEALVSTMQESWKKVSFLRDYDMRLPQMRANTLTVLGRRRNIFKSIKNVGQYWFNITELDTEYNDDYEVVPDGKGGTRRREFVPVRFIKKLDSPEYITSDLVGSVTQFYKMATDFQIKSQYAPAFQLFLDKLKYNSSDNSLKKATHMINTQIFGREENTDTNKDNTSDSQAKKTGIKMLKHTRAATQLGLLAFNITSGIVSFLDPFLSLVADAVTGKYTNIWDNTKALGILAWNFPSAVASLGRITPHSKVAAGMQKFCLQKGIASTYKNTYQSQVRRFLEDGLSMKIFSVGDYTMNAITLVSTMQNYRLYENGNKWMHKQEFIEQAMKDGKTRKEAKSMYRDAKTMWNAYELKDGKFVPKDNEAGRTITPRDEFVIRQQVKARVSIYNGIVDENEKTLLQTNIYLRFVTMLRNFFITGMWERFKNLRDFQIPLYDETLQSEWVGDNGDILVKSASTEEAARTKLSQSYYKGGYNFNTRRIEDGIFTGFNRIVGNILPYFKYLLFITNPNRCGSSHIEERDARRKQGFRNKKGHIVTISEQDLYAMNKILTEIGIMGLVLFAQTLMARSIDDDDDPPIAILSTYAILVRLVQERATWYNPSTFFDIITTITTSWSDLERKFKAVEYLWDLLGITGHDPSDIVQRGIYKGHTRAFRDLMMLTSSLGTHNLLSSFSEEGVSSKVRFYESILPFWAKLVQPKDDQLKKSSKSSSSQSFSSGFDSGFSSKDFSTGF